MNTKRKIKSTQIVTICPIPIPPNKKLIGFGSFEKVTLKLVGGSGPLDPPASYAPDCKIGKQSIINNRKPAIQIQKNILNDSLEIYVISETVLF